MKNKIINTIIISAIALNMAVANVSAIDKQNPYDIVTSENGITYELWSDGSFTSNSVKDLSTNAKSIKIPNTINYDNETFEIDTLSFLNNNKHQKPQSMKTCEKLSMDNADIFMGISNWCKLKEIKVSNVHTYFGHINSCKKLQKIFVSGCKGSETSVSDISNNKNLKVITFKNIYQIETKTVYKCSKLKTIIFSGNIENIDYKAFDKCTNLSMVKVDSAKKSPKIEENAFKGTKKGIKFYVKNKKVAKSLKKQLKGSGVRKAKIYVGKTLVYKNVK